MPEVAGAVTYCVDAVTKDGLVSIASGLTTPSFTGIPAQLGVMTFTVTASNSNGDGPASEPTRVTVQNPAAKERPMVMH